ncbi:hypothetical protein N8I77_004998 [Diaporthe amygdali]|uniref:Uncharacterized protein n=1 Tax=Phomopsis amygdali TaxID=1214568 RepID=A0AAD9SM28_PHOAM|nr:uncharacterized protein J7T55_015425 [Diaporthe amygdali]KAJ0120693.1 hypothetical protein J7T55_015425 [Diaporthe amygdali]KAK2611668.1 hypothetical protein N8I77_004998 [Diaporthe amygdali]
MSAFRAGLSLCSRRVTASSGRVLSRPQNTATSAKRCYSDLPFYAYTSTIGLGGLPLAFGGAAGVMGTGLYALGKDPREIKHNDHEAQMALNPKRMYRDSKSTRWTAV